MRNEVGAGRIVNPGERGWELPSDGGVGTQLDPPAATPTPSGQIIITLPPPPPIVLPIQQPEPIIPSTNEPVTPEPVAVVTPINPPAPPITKVEVDAYYYPAAPPPATSSLDILNEIADAMMPPPAVINRAYADRVVDAAKFLNVPVNIARPNVPESAEASLSVTVKNQSLPWYSPLDAEGQAYLAQLKASWSGMAKEYVQTVTTPKLWVDNEYERTRAMQATANILALINRVENFASRAAAAGRLPPDSPFSALADINRQRAGKFVPFKISDTYADDILYSVKVYLNLLDAENQGGIDFKNSVITTSQLSHVKLSFDGLGGSGNPAADVLQFLPDADAVKRKNAADALSVVDFSKRVPKLLFTMEYTPDVNGNSQGVLLGWRKIADASGYIVRRRDVFSGKTVSWSVDNSELGSYSLQYMQYAKLFAMSFMDSLDDRSTCVFLDNNIADNEYYVYKIQAYQVRSEKTGAIFSVETTPMGLTLANRTAVDQVLAQMGQNASPWPAFSQYLYNNSNLDWILAAANTRASVDRADDKPTTRAYSYLNANASFLYSQATAGKLVKPTSIDVIQKNIEDAIVKFGVNQTIQMLLDETGISYYYEGRDVGEDTHFDRAGTEGVRTSKLFRSIGAAIDPATALLDLRTLASNMTQLLDSSLLSANTALQPGSTQSAAAVPVEVEVVSPEESNASTAEGPLQFLNIIGKLSDPYVDLTTFEDLSKLMRVLRIMSDVNSRVMSPPQPANPVPVTVAPVTPPTAPTPVSPPPVQTVETEPATEPSFRSTLAMRRAGIFTLQQLLDNPSWYLNQTISSVTGRPRKTALPPELQDSEDE